MRADGQGVPGVGGILDDGGVARRAVVGLEVLGIDVAGRDDEQPGGVRGGHAENVDVVGRLADVDASGERVYGGRPEGRFSRSIGVGRDGHAVNARTMRRGGFGGSDGRSCHDPVGQRVVVGAGVGKDLD